MKEELTGDVLEAAQRITENLEEDSLEEFLIILPTSRARDKHDVLKPRINELLHHEAWNIEPLKTGMSDKLSAAVAQLKRKYGHSEQMQKVFEEMNEIVQFPF